MDRSKVLLITLAAVSLVIVSTVLADQCSESGYAWCNEFQYGDAYVKMALSVYDVNNIQWSTGSQSVPYVLVKDGFKIKYDCNGDAYYDMHDCTYDGCQGQRIASSGLMTIGSGLSESVYMKRIGCFIQTPSNWAYSWFIEFYPAYGDKKVEILNCGQDNDCTDSETCSMSGNPTTWSCKNVVCPVPNCQEWESAGQTIADHTCMITCNLAGGRCLSNNDCSANVTGASGETCNTDSHRCVTVNCDDNDPCTDDTYDTIGMQCIHNRIYTGQCDPCVVASAKGLINDKKSCTTDECHVDNGQAAISHTPIPNCIEDNVKIIIIAAVAGMAAIIIFAVVWLKMKGKFRKGHK